MSTEEQNRLQILNGVLERYWSMQEAAPLLGVSERQDGDCWQSIAGKVPGDWCIRAVVGYHPTSLQRLSSSKW